jgi:hypothetical protein
MVPAQRDHDEPTLKTIVVIEQHYDHDLADGQDRRPLQRPGRDF